MADTITFAIQGMSCANCAVTIERVLGKLSGVHTCVVNFGMEQVTVEYDRHTLQEAQIQQAIASAGFGAVSLTDQENPDVDLDAMHQAQQRVLLIRFWLGAVISTILMVGGWPMMTGWSLPLVPDWLGNHWLHMVLRRQSSFGAAACFTSGPIKPLNAVALT